MSAWVIRGASVLGEKTADLYVDGGVLVDEAPAGATLVEADGLVALPGLVDLHTHLREPGREDAETVLTGSRAAALGGYTAVLAMANTNPVTDTAEAAEHVFDLGRAAGLVDVQPVGAVTHGLGGEELAELGLMHRSRAQVRVFSDDGRCVADPRVMRRALEYVRAFGGVVSQHSQDPHLAGSAACCHEGELSGRLGLPGWPGVAEETIVARDVMLARHTGSRLHVAHVSTAGSVEVIRWAKAQGIDVTAEVTPHHLLLTTDLLGDYDPVYKVNPPLRPTRTSPRCATPWPTAPSTRWPPTTRRTRATTRSTPSSTRPSGCSAWRPRSPVVSEVMVTSRRDDLDRRRAGDVADARPDRRSRGPRAAPSRSASRRTSRWSTLPRCRWSTRTVRLAVAQQPLARAQAHRCGGARPSTAGRRPCWTARWRRSPRRVSHPIRARSARTRRPARRPARGRAGRAWPGSGSRASWRSSR